jgi:anti-anti-sigma regulatory factor
VIYSCLCSTRGSSIAAVEVVVSQTEAGPLIQIKGNARAECAGALLAELLVSKHWPAMVTLDLSELDSISGMALSVLAAYRRSVVRTGARVRLTGVLRPAVWAALARTEMLDWFEPERAAQRGG